jgi:hypothetical protein
MDLTKGKCNYRILYEIHKQILKKLLYIIEEEKLNLFHRIL